MVPQAGWILRARLQFLEKLTLIQGVFEGFASVDEDDRHLLVVEALKFGIGVDIDLAPLEGGA